jgi:hypothetical protein
MPLLERVTRLDQRVLPRARRQPTDRKLFQSLLIAQVWALVAVFLAIYNPLFISMAVPMIGMTILQLARRLPPRDD